MHLFWYFWVHKAYIAGTQYPKNFDRDSNLKICLLPGLEVQKVEKHWCRAVVPNFLCSHTPKYKNR